MIVNNHISRLVVLCLITLVVACDKSDEWVMRSYESERYSFTRFLGGIEKFPYTADQSKYSKVKVGFMRLSLKMQKDDVKKIIGEPDYEMLHYVPTQKKEMLLYSTWVYVLRRFESNLGNIQFDEAVVLYFKPNDELYWADPGKISDLKTLGGPDLYPESTITIPKR